MTQVGEQLGVEVVAPTPSCASPPPAPQSPTSPSRPSRAPYDRQSGEWKDCEALFLRCNVWRGGGLDVDQASALLAEVEALLNG